MTTNQEPTRGKRVKSVAFAAVLWAGIALVLVVVLRTLLGYSGDNWTLILCAFFLVFVSRIDDLALLSLGPLKAELRAKITEAAATLDQLRSIAAALTSFMLSEAAASWFQEGQPTDSQLVLADDCAKALDRIGVSAEDQQKARERWALGVRMVFARAIQYEVERAVRGGLSVMTAVSPASPSFMSTRPWSASEPDEVEASLKERHLLVGDVPELLADYRQFVADGTFRRRAVFAKAAAG